MNTSKLKIYKVNSSAFVIKLNAKTTLEQGHSFDYYIVPGRDKIWRGPFRFDNDEVEEVTPLEFLLAHGQSAEACFGTDMLEYIEHED